MSINVDTRYTGLQASALRAAADDLERRAHEHEAAAIRVIKAAVERATTIEEARAMQTAPNPFEFYAVGIREAVALLQQRADDLLAKPVKRAPRTFDEAPQQSDDADDADGEPESSA